MGIPSDERFLAVAAKRLMHLFPQLPQRPGYWKRQRLAGVVRQHQVSDLVGHLGPDALALVAALHEAALDAYGRAIHF